MSITDEYQPLEKYIFGVLKSQACAIFNEKEFNFQQAFTKSEATDVFVSYWNDLKIRIEENTESKYWFSCESNEYKRISYKFN